MGRPCWAGVPYYPLRVVSGGAGHVTPTSYRRSPPPATSFCRIGGEVSSCRRRSIAWPNGPVYFFAPVLAGVAAAVSHRSAVAPNAFGVAMVVRTSGGNFLARPTIRIDPAASRSAMDATFRLHHEGRVNHQAETFRRKSPYRSTNRPSPPVGTGRLRRRRGRATTCRSACRRA